MTYGYSTHRSSKRPLTDFEVQRRDCGKAFRKRYPTEKSCWVELIDRLGSLGLLQCGVCRSQMVGTKELRIIECTICGMRRSASTGTVFERVRRLMPYFATMWFQEHGIVVTSVWLHEFCEIAQSSALSMQRKFRVVVGSLLVEDVERLPSIVFWETMSRRSLETPARQHPREEETEAHKASASAATGAAAMPGAPPGASPHATASSFAHSGSSSGSAAFTTPFGAAAAAAGKPKDNGWSPFAKEPPPKSMQRKTSLDYPQLDAAQKQIFDLLSQVSLSFDQLIAATGLSPNALSCALTVLEIEGLIVKQNGGSYEQSSDDCKNSTCFYNEKIEATDDNEADDGLSAEGNEADVLENVRGSKGTLVRVGDVLPTANRKSLAASMVSPLSKKLQKRLQDFIVENFKGISRKYLQLYMSDYWLSWDRVRWHPGAMLMESLLSPPITYEQILKFVTAPIVLVRTSLSALA